MGRLDDNASLERLRQANAYLSQFFEFSCGAAVLGTNQELAAMLQVELTLKSVGALLKEGLQISEDAGVRLELARYRENLLHLRSELATMQQSAADCRARLQSRQNHLQAAQAWCTAARATG